MLPMRSSALLQMEFLLLGVKPILGGGGTVDGSVVDSIVVISVFVNDEELVIVVRVLDSTVVTGNEGDTCAIADKVANRMRRQSGQQDGLSRQIRRRLYFLHRRSFKWCDRNQCK
ncbi:hypothetical protein NDU88_004608 [Pleurodeles waltl]|uniref:Secreted protein n=1 Tax=Pleurodeles waltl TaxID=8319 RepID=A0AAV7LLU7_PLEWA|nr:hypothetical protein NDU88_004608 [Pleurodeles waltl]